MVHRLFEIKCEIQSRQVSKMNQYFEVNAGSSQEEEHTLASRTTIDLFPVTNSQPYIHGSSSLIAVIGGLQIRSPFRLVIVSRLSQMNVNNEGHTYSSRRKSL